MLFYCFQLFNYSIIQIKLLVFSCVLSNVEERHYICMDIFKGLIPNFYQSITALDVVSADCLKGYICFP